MHSQLSRFPDNPKTSNPASGPASEAGWRVLASTEDLSQNFVMQVPDGGMIECRFVRRTDDYFIVYLSSHSGCRHACRFCHLTQTGQTSFTPVNLDGYLSQAERVLSHYDAANHPARQVNFNFMARGEALSNPLLAGDWPRLARELRKLAALRDLSPRFNISTIMPEEAAALDLATMYDTPDVAFYYSLYSLDPAFRRRWLPRAADPVSSLRRLAAWQRATGGEIVLHWALIAGENDDPAMASDIAQVVRDAGITARFNLVRYNPFDGRSAETDEATMTAYFERISAALGSPLSRIIPRVGFDVKASCGMFVEANPD